MLVNIANEQAKEGADVHIVIINDLYKQDLLQQFDRRIKVHLLHRRVGSYSPLFLLKLNMLLLKLAPNAIHLHDSCFIKALMSKRLRGMACCTLHALPYGETRGRGLLSRIVPVKDITMKSNVTFIDEVPRVFAISQAVKDELLAKYGVDSTVVANGIIARNILQRESMAPHSPVRAVQVSRLAHETKGQDLLIKAVANLRGMLTVDFIGEGDSLEYLQNLTTELGANEWVRFSGLKTQAYIAEHLCDYDVFVQASRYEGFGLTVAEAMAAQLPTLVSSGQGPAEVVCGTKYGWVFENGNVDDLTGRLKFISTHYDEALRKAEAGLRYVRNTYDVSVTAKTYLKQYKSIT